ncbi:hypothetical protein CHLNCDRAFT_51983 [Chlorella variabilis]|uniref:PHD-type domain-containing protein n=1 Tax=Chlorella variabilis TaxID=554065 RepID=E1ZDX9_CHLVA|nr:hypothetical protein CHLNCDRAFT_51983 [Chlorella variabilis]EFN55772.1 hypothetical protein CHLNCDRAFT_51983 [Chlorella variabilis]|eukprot:XP_005847874.1 hypothetical protein CHLNCDRAFT_51983 [Chlorella variabilis]
MDPRYAAAQLRLRQHTVLLLNEKGLRGSQLREAVNSAATQMGLPLTAIPHDVARLVAAYSQPAAASTAAADVAARQQLAPAGAAQARNPSAQAQAASHQEQLRISMERIQRAAPVAAAAAAAAAAAGRTGSSQPPTSAELTAMRAAYLAHLNGATSGATTAAAADSMARKQKKKRKSAADAAGTAAAAAAGEPMVELEEEEDMEEGGAVGTDENEDGHTYAEYRAMQIRAMHPDIMGHPDALVETASLASVPLPAPSFQHSLHDCVAERLLSDAQLETIVYANMKFNGPRLPDGKRAGFFLGDGAGVGKGRQIGGLIKQHWADGGRRVLWVSVSADLRHDAARDLRDVRASRIPICPRGSESVPTGRGLERFGDGCLFITYSLLISGLGSKKARGQDEEEGEAQNVEAGRLLVPPGSRLAQIVAWLQGGKGQPPLLVFDECHKAKNLLPSGGAQPTMTARAVVEIQAGGAGGFTACSPTVEQLPDAKVLYSSATGASEPKNLAYMTRLGLFGFKDAQDMIELLSKSKLGALELAAMSLKATGTYLSRTLSYAGAEFALGYVDVDEVFKVMYDRATSFWTLLWKIVQCHPRLKKLQGVFWSANQRFWKQLLMASKVPACALMAKEAMQNGMAVVIGLQSTGEANTDLLKETSGNNFDDLVSAPRMILEQYIRGHFPLDTAGADRAELDSLEYQVFNAIQTWRDMPSASQVVAAKAQGREVQHAAALMGFRVNRRERQSEDAIIAMRLKMKKAAQEEEAKWVERAHQEKLEQWQRRRAAQERRLRLEKEQAEEDVAAAEAAVARLHGKAKAAPAAATAGLEASSSDEEGGQTLAARAGGCGGSAKRKAAVLEDSEDERDGGKENAAQRHTAKRPPASRRRVLDGDSDSSSDDELPLSARPPLAPRGAGAGGQPPLAFRLVAEPVEIDLTLDDDIECMICGREDDEENMMLCDGCDRGCHTLCAGLRRLPCSTTWLCSGCSAAQNSKTGGAAKQQQQQQHGRLHKRTAAAGLSDSEDDAGLLSAPRVAPQTAGSKMQLLAAERRLETAKRQLRTAELELEAFEEQTAEGPPPTPQRAPRLGHRQQASRICRPPASRCRQLRRAAPQARAGSTSFDPTVRNLQLTSRGVAGYRHAVKVHGLADMQLPAGMGAQLAAREEARLAAQEARAPEAEEGAFDLGGMGPDFKPQEGDPNADISLQLLRMRGWLLRIVNAMELPPNPLDHLIELLGGEQHVAELTGRKGFVSKDEGSGRAMYVQRGGDGPQKDVNMREKEAFMEGRKLVAIISDAASTGISLQADRRVGNQRRRCHITLELPWSADKAVQQFGRSHRANQVSAPLYRILTVPVGGEYRFASAAAKRLASLGALLRGDRNAIGAGSELKGFDIDNAHGEKALLRVLQDVCGEHGSKPMPGVKVPELPPELAESEFLHTSGMDELMERSGREATPPFFKYMRTKLLSIGVLEEGGEGTGRILVPSAKAKVKIPRFLNRLLGLPMVDQELLFQYFQDTLDATVAQLKSEGKFDSGIVTIKGRSCKVVSKRPIYRDATSGGEVQHVELSLDRGLPWEAALAFKNEVEEKLEEQEPGRRHLSGFYVQRGKDVMAGGRRRNTIMLATEIIKSASNIRNTRFHIQKPNLGSCPSKTLQEMDEQGFRRMPDKDAEALWNFWFAHTEHHCMHGGQKLEKWHDRSQWGRHSKGTGNKLPLRVVKTIQEDGLPLVGVEATNREELLYFEQCLSQPEVEEQAGALQRARLQQQQGGPAAAALAAAGFGLPPYHGSYRPHKKKGGGRGRHFR